MNEKLQEHKLEVEANNEIYGSGLIMNFHADREADVHMVRLTDLKIHGNEYKNMPRRTDSQCCG